MAPTRPLRRPLDADLNIASFSKLWIDEDGIVRDTKTPIVDELHEAAVAYGDRTPATRPVTVQDLLGHTKNAPDETVEGVDRDPETFRLSDLLRAGSSKNVLVPEAGFEPARPCEQSILSAPCLPFHHSGESAGQAYVRPRDRLQSVVHQTQQPGPSRPQIKPPVAEATTRTAPMFASPRALHRRRSARNRSRELSDRRERPCSWRRPCGARATRWSSRGSRAANRPR